MQKQATSQEERGRTSDSKTYPVAVKQVKWWEEEQVVVGAISDLVEELIIGTGYVAFQELLDSLTHTNLTEAWWAEAPFPKVEIEKNIPRERLTKKQKRNQKKTYHRENNDNNGKNPNPKKHVLSVAGNFRQSQLEYPTLKQAWHNALTNINSTGAIGELQPLHHYGSATQEEGPEIPRRCKEEQRTKQRRIREDHKEDRGTQRSTEEEEMRDDELRETKNGNVCHRTPIKTLPRDNREGERYMQKPATFQEERGPTSYVKRTGEREGNENHQKEQFYKSDLRNSKALVNRSMAKWVDAQDK
ncbi:hypothetical protein NDU88_001819 [Pleurodeles waltl]|uniref:Uncharacterized protein n=1 Tax=Pleurodeles waltl TaxID=8319 RepID=A0AAV7LIL4_PLEWA|nr:hypothetical protein NDU88_001819 [Pleurodeles waltl]